MTSVDLDAKNNNIIVLNIFITDDMILAIWLKLIDLYMHKNVGI